MQQYSRCPLKRKININVLETETQMVNILMLHSQFERRKEKEGGQFVILKIWCEKAWLGAW